VTWTGESLSLRVAEEGGCLCLVMQVQFNARE
jgi:hypothetical protein